MTEKPLIKQMTTNKFKYPIGKCQSLHQNKEGRIVSAKDQEESELIGYSFFNVQMIDNGRVYPTGEKQKVPTCLKCYLFEKPIMEDRMAEEKVSNPSLIPYKWFWFYNEEDEKKYPDNWERRYEKHLAKRKIWKKYPEKDCNTIEEVPEYQEWQRKFKDCLDWDEKPWTTIKSYE